MHQRLFVTFNKDNAKTSEEARQYAKDTLEQDDSFCGEGGRFGSPVADWFVIGGRWSGKLSEHTWAKNVIEKIEALEEKENIQIRGCFYGEGRKTKQQAKLRKIVEKMYLDAMPKEWENKGLIYDRDTSANFEDDAMLVTNELYGEVLKKYSGLDKKEDEFNDLEFIDLDYDLVDLGFVGTKWLVVVDYHS